MNRSLSRLAVAMIGVALLAAACSSSSKSSSTGASPTTSGNAPTTTASGGGGGGGMETGQGNAGGGALADEAASAASTLTGAKGSGLTRGITGSQITVGCVYQANSFAGYEQGLQARFARANKAGGVNGRKINLLPCKDDGSSVQTNVQDVQQLVNQNSVFAIFTATQEILAGSTDFLNANQVPYYGWGFNPGFCGTRWGFGWNGCLGGNSLTKSQVAHAAIQGNLAQAIIKASGMQPSQVRFAVQSENSASGKVGNGQYTSLFKQLGATVVYAETNFPATTAVADVTPYVQAIMASNPNIVYISTPFADVGPLAAGLKTAGYKGIIMDFTNYVPGLLQAEPQLAQALDGEYVNTQVVPQEQNTAYIQQITTDLQAIGQKPFVTLGGEIGYDEAEQFVEELQAIGQTLNTQTWDQKINGGGFTSYATLDGGPGKLQWPAAHLLPADCAAIVKVSGTSFQVVTPFQCYDSFKVF